MLRRPPKKPIGPAGGPHLTKLLMRILCVVIAELCAAARANVITSWRIGQSIKKAYWASVSHMSTLSTLPQSQAKYAASPP